MTKELVAYLRSIGNTDKNGEPSAELLAATEIERLDADAAGAQAELASVKLERHQLRNELTAAGLENKRLTRTLESVRASLLPYRTGHVKDLAAANIRLIDEALTGAAAEPNEQLYRLVPLSLDGPAPKSAPEPGACPHPDDNRVMVVKCTLCGDPDIAKSAKEASTDGWQCVTCGHENPPRVLRCQNIKCTALKSVSAHLPNQAQWCQDPDCPQCASQRTFE